ncbi:MAG: retron Ec67 family RNA-directed DNA polymerase/endonuclease [Desulfobacterales bacterium]|nr:retron Ec67 family RNA-directed DNA polymerase/endonuclease [Desulfobacterales bacterium]MDD4073499.1 retron Ec67 family RNA-directed DNA polymerase/endonuclease [Desulfobacterales bacterium]MDD4393834.1 retron Ec67 family RNA-directed DNA polymerase/endonuclease [Desulfobacterales bacterium]
MSALEKIKKTTSLSEIAILLGYKPKSLSYILYKIPNKDKYTEFTIPKNNGSERKIKAPVDQLKTLQKRLAKLLNKCFDEISTNSKHKKSLSHGFRKNHSIITNAINHKNKRHVFNIDLQDFFPSINFGRVRGFFIKNAHFQLDPKIATVIAQIACHDNELPQGSPCSPIISNLIGHLLDIRMVNLAKKSKCTYSRYADDLTFSTNRKEFPEKIAIKKNGADNKWIPGNALRKEIKKVGFTINEKKTSLQYKTERQIVTGLVVNEKVNIKREYYRQARSMCHALFQSNKFYIDSKNVSEPAVSENSKVIYTSSYNSAITPYVRYKSKKVIGNIKQLEGILSFIYHIKISHDERTIGDKRFKPTAVMKLYRELLFYKHFFILNRPLIICEGKTDIVYLKCALRHLEKEYGELVQKKGDDFVFKVSFIDLSKNLKDVFAISAGTSGLVSLMKIYKTHMKPFKGQGKKHPVIMLVDNDSGSKEIKKKLVDSDSKKPFSWFVENLYVVQIPHVSGHEETAIEDLFDKETLETKVSGKKFNRKTKINPQTEYGKIVFSEKVVKVNQNTISFDGFKEIMNRFKGVIEDYKQKKAEPKTATD